MIFYNPKQNGQKEGKYETHIYVGFIVCLSDVYILRLCACPYRGGQPYASAEIKR